MVSGELRQRQWEDNGERKYSTIINVRDCVFLDYSTDVNGTSTSNNRPPMEENPNPDGDMPDDLEF